MSINPTQLLVTQEHFCMINTVQLSLIDITLDLIILSLQQWLGFRILKVGVDIKNFDM